MARFRWHDPNCYYVLDVAELVICDSTAIPGRTLSPCQLNNGGIPQHLGVRFADKSSTLSKL